MTAGTSASPTPAPRGWEAVLLSCGGGQRSQLWLRCEHGLFYSGHGAPGSPRRAEVVTGAGSTQRDSSGAGASALGGALSVCEPVSLACSLPPPSPEAVGLEMAPPRVRHSLSDPRHPCPFGGLHCSQCPGCLWWGSWPVSPQHYSGRHGFWSLVWNVSSSCRGTKVVVFSK